MTLARVAGDRPRRFLYYVTFGACDDIAEDGLFVRRRGTREHRRAEHSYMEEWLRLLLLVKSWSFDVDTTVNDRGFEAANWPEIDRVSGEFFRLGW